jgi:enamine deaminase RidA (YjgF/YER057c/UK114 family)
MLSVSRVDCGELPVEANLSMYRPEAGVTEAHITVSGRGSADFPVQVDNLLTAYERAMHQAGTDPSSAVFRRVFCSDPANQAPVLRANALLNGHGAVSLVGQAPVGPAKIALWAYHLIEPGGTLHTRREEATFALQRNGLTHYWTTNLSAPDGTDSYGQTEQVLTRYRDELDRRGMSLSEHLVRTWFFVRDVDVNYSGLVEARRRLFADYGLTAQTHYTASTGIGAEAESPQSLVQMDAWAIGGLRPEQIQYLKALGHLSPTHAYGVTFERATALHYRRRTHVLISGTASINAQGEILHPGSVTGQLDRALENVDALLAEVGGTAAAMTHWIVYLRDDSDEPVVRAQMRRRYGEAPMVFVHAPVCRPGWLVEVEGIAVLPANAPELPEF